MAAPIDSERKEIQINFSDGTSCIVVVDGKTYAAVQNENPQTITALKDMYGQLLLKGNELSTQPLYPSEVAASSGTQSDISQNAVLQNIDVTAAELIPDFQSQQLPSLQPFAQVIHPSEHAVPTLHTDLLHEVGFITSQSPPHLLNQSQTDEPPSHLVSQSQTSQPSIGINDQSQSNQTSGDPVNQSVISTAPPVLHKTQIDTPTLVKTLINPSVVGKTPSIANSSVSLWSSPNNIARAVLESPTIAKAYPTVATAVNLDTHAVRSTTPTDDKHILGTPTVITARKTTPTIPKIAFDSTSITKVTGSDPISHADIPTVKLKLEVPDKVENGSVDGSLDDEEDDIQTLDGSEGSQEGSDSESDLDHHSFHTAEHTTDRTPRCLTTRGWDDQGLLLLITLWGERKAELYATATRKKKLWASMAEILNKHGYCFTWSECRSAWKVMITNYEVSLENNNSAICRFFDEMTYVHSTSAEDLQHDSENCGPGKRKKHGRSGSPQKRHKAGLSEKRQMYHQSFPQNSTLTDSVEVLNLVTEMNKDLNAMKRDRMKLAQELHTENINMLGKFVDLLKDRKDREQEEMPMDVTENVKTEITVDEHMDMYLT